MEQRVCALGEIVADAIRRMVRELLARRPGGHLVEAELDELELEIALPWSDDPRAWGEAVAGKLERLIDEAIERVAAFRPGHAFCYRCAASACEHSRPPTSRHVFSGYGPTGEPRWQDFAQACLEYRHSEVDRLYEDPPALLTLQQRGDELERGLLGAFRTPSSELLGQVAAGFFPLPVRREAGRVVAALSFQVVVSRLPNGKARLGLNVLGRAPEGDGFAALWDRGGEPPWVRAVRWAQTALRTVRMPRGAAAGDRADEGTARRVEAILRGLARRLERDRRARGRRTQHAEDRHASGKRPTRKAVDDARAATGDDVMVDSRSGAIVVLGERGRTHFFTNEGRLVSSVRYSRDAIERKRKLGFWRSATPGEAAALREKISDRAS